MLATPSETAIGSLPISTESGSLRDEPIAKDVTLEILGERRAEWREGFDSGLRAGTQRALNSHALEAIVFELNLLREAAKNLGEKCDFWMRKSDEFELEATYWYQVVANSSPLAVAAMKPVPKDPSAGGLDPVNYIAVRSDA